MSNSSEYINACVPPEMQETVREKVKNAKETIKESVAKILEEFEKIAHEAWKESYPSIDNKRLENVYHMGLFLEFQRALALKYGVNIENQYSGQSE